jgi:competence protein ComEC
LIDAFSAGVVAWVILIPLAAYHFEQFNPWTVPFGIVLSPFAAFALLGGFLKIALTALCPGLGACWAAAAGFFSHLLQTVLHGLSCVPWCDLPMSRPSIGSIVAYYALLAFPLIPVAVPVVRRAMRLAPTGSLFLLVLPFIGAVHPDGSPTQSLRVTILSVGAGQCAVVEPAGGGVALIDAGSSTLTDVERSCIDPFLRHERCLSIDSIWLSHGDYDHISATGALIPAYAVREVMTSPHFRRHAPESKTCAGLLRMLDQSGHSPRQLVAGAKFSLGRNAQVEVLWPPADCRFNSNNAGMVLRLTSAGRSILFPADIQEPAEIELLKHPERLRSDVLVAPHHGSREATTAEFIAAVHPRWIVASSDSRLTKKQRSFDAESGTRPVYRTGRCGALTIEVTSDGTIQMHTFLGSDMIAWKPASP